MRSELYVQLAGELWRITVPARWADHFRDVFAHLLRPPTIDTAVAIEVKDTLDGATGASGAMQWLERFPDPEAIVVNRSDENWIQVSRLAYCRYDLKKQTGEFCLVDPSMEALLLGSNLLLQHIAWRALQRSLVPLHAAAVGRDGNYWLIPAGAGRGKSMIAAVAIAAGLDILADDFLLWDPAEDLIFSLYQTIRLRNDGLEMIRRKFGVSCLHEIHQRDDQKHILKPSPSSHGAVRRQGNLKGMLSPERAKCGAIGSVLSPAEALRTFSSTLLMLPTLGLDPAATFRQLIGLTTRVPMRELSTGGGVEELAHSLHHVCEAAA